MRFSRQLGLSTLIELCRVLRHNLAAGLSLVKVFRQQGQRGPAGVRPLAERVGARLEQGESLDAALDHEKAYFPPLFLDLARVGEETGSLPEVFGELEKYYAMQQRLWREFLGQILWPAFQFVAAVFVMAGMILIMGILASINPGYKPIPLLGKWFTGPGGALAFLVLVFGSLAAVYGLYVLASRTLRHKAVVDALLLRVPVVGPCLMALCLTRFCIALRLTLETGMPVRLALRLSLRATGNAAFAARSDAVEKSLRSGEDLGAALAGAQVFPHEFLNMLTMAEEGGRVPEMMRHQAGHYEDEARRRLVVLNRVAGFGVWLAVAAMIIWAIFRIYSTTIAPAYSGV